MPLLLRPNKKVAPFLFASVSRLRHRFPVPLAMEFSIGTSVSVAKLQLKCLRPPTSIAIMLRHLPRRALERAGFESQLLD
jgi:hypothetical protein